MNPQTPHTQPEPGHPEPAVWLDLLDPRHRDAPADAALHEHLAACGACQKLAEDVRRYQTLLLRGKAPGLTPEQRQSLDERVHLMSGRWQKPPRVSPGFIWGLALASAAALVFTATKPFLEKSHQNQVTFQQMVVDATAPSADNPGAGAVVSVVEGDVEVAAQDGRWRKLAGGDTLRFGQHVRTHTGSPVPGRIVVPGRFELTLAPDTELEVLAMAERDAFWRLRHGEVGCQVDKLKPGQRYGVMFAGFRASVVGTRFVVRHDEQDAGVAVQVTEGAVRVDQADDPYGLPGDTMTTVRAGQRWQFAAGRMALEPIPQASQAPLPTAQPAIQPAPAAMPATPGAVPSLSAPTVMPPAGPLAPNASGTDGLLVGPSHATSTRELPPREVPPREALPWAGRDAAPHAGSVNRATGVIQPRPIVIEVPPQHMPPPEQLPVQNATPQAGRAEPPTFER